MLAASSLFQGYLQGCSWAVAVLHCWSLKVKAAASCRQCRWWPAGLCSLCMAAISAINQAASFTLLRPACRDGGLILARSPGYMNTKYYHLWNLSAQEVNNKVGRSANSICASDGVLHSASGQVQTLRCGDADCRPSCRGLSRWQSWGTSSWRPGVGDSGSAACHCLLHLTMQGSGRLLHRCRFPLAAPAPPLATACSTRGASGARSPL